VRLLRIFATILAAGAAFAAEPFYLSVWKIESAVAAPWGHQPDASESKTLVGKTVTITPMAISGPGILACKGPKYKVVEIPAEGLFQGAFDEMHRADKPADPVKLAAKFGFKGTSWKSLQTGCANELDFHFVDPNTAEFGLNDFIYTLKKQ
jgi:hypothetical protein